MIKVGHYLYRPDHQINPILNPSSTDSLHPHYTSLWTAQRRYPGGRDVAPVGAAAGASTGAILPGVDTAPPQGSPAEAFRGARDGSTCLSAGVSPHEVLASPLPSTQRAI